MPACMYVCLLTQTRTHSFVCIHSHRHTLVLGVAVTLVCNRENPCCTPVAPLLLITTFSCKCVSLDRADKCMLIPLPRPLHLGESVHQKQINQSIFNHEYA